MKKGRGRRKVSFHLLRAWSGQEEEARTTSSSLEDSVRSDQAEEGVDALALARELDRDGCGTNVDGPAAKLLAEALNGGEVLALADERLRVREQVLMLDLLLLLGEVLRRLFLSGLGRRLEAALGRQVGEVVRRVDRRVERWSGRDLGLEVLGSEQTIKNSRSATRVKVGGPDERRGDEPKSGELDEQELSLDDVGVGVIQNGPDRNLTIRRVVLKSVRRACGFSWGEETYEVLEGPSSLLDRTVLASEDDAHARKVSDLRSADNEGVCVGEAKR